MRSAGFRFFTVGLLALLMFVPLFFAGEIVGSRADYSDQTIREVGREWGGEQVISGPQLRVPVEGPVTRNEQIEVTNPETGAIEYRTVERTETGAKAPIYLLPNTFTADVTTETEIRSRGIFNVPVFTAEAEIGARFTIPDLANQLSEGDRILWDRATLEVGISANNALRGETVLLVDGKTSPLEPSQRNNYGTIYSAVGDPRENTDYALSLRFNGAERLFFAPVGRSSQVTLASDWPHPSFTGAFLPDSSEISAAGFTARWSIPHLARALPQISRADVDGEARYLSFGVRYFQPNDFYQKAYRAARYGILFIALTFLTVLLIENRQEKPAHPVQYILIGLAQSTFVLLMVAYAEQIGFGPAYLLSSGATIALLTMYGAVGLGLGRRTLVLCLTLVLLYGVLYLILQSADYALLAGSTLAFLALAGTMYATRNEDWYGPPREGKKRSFWGGKAPETAAPPPA